MRLFARLGSVLVIVFFAIGAGGAAWADTIGDVATTLRSQSVYVDPAVTNPAHTITAEQASALRQQIAAADVPVYIAIVSPETVGGETDPKVVYEKLQAEVGLNGAYAVVLDGDPNAQFVAKATGDRASQVAAMATSAANANRGNLAGALQDFVAQVGKTYGAGTGIPSNPASTLVPLGIGAVVVGGGGYWLYRRSKASNAARLAEVRTTIDEDVTSYGELVASLDTDDPQLAGEGQVDAQKALDAYEKAKAAASAMTRPDDARQVTEALEEGRYHLACVEARRNGTPLPERRPPCFVDPRHGPSVEDVEWAPDGGTPRPVPVCAACATELKQGQLPAAREVQVGGRSVPYWRAGGAYQPYATGYYNAYAGVLPAILIGSMMGGMMGGQGGYDPGTSGAPDDGGWGGGFGGGGGWDGGGGGFGDGGFGGGGDFGGGDF